MTILQPLALGRNSLARALTLWSILIASAILVFTASLMLGSVRIPPMQIWHALYTHDESVAAQILYTLRVPRATAGFASGALLALAGTLLQALLRNPLADPYVLGVSGGAASFALAAMMLSLSGPAIQAASFIGALLAIVLVLGIARRELWLSDAQHSSARLLLTGVALAAGWSALIMLLLTIAPERALRGMLFWLAGDLNGVKHTLPAVLTLIGALALSLPVAPRLNVLLHGETTTRALGIAVTPLRLRLYLIASLSTAIAVTTAGTIGFVGLVAPHLLRLAYGNDQRILLPAATLAGGILVMAADLAARTLVAPAQWPVGTLTAILGVPLFLWILLRTCPRSF